MVKNLINKRKVVILIICVLSQIFVACESIDTTPISLSEQAIKYSFPKNNILSLKSVIIDKNTQNNSQ